MSGAGADNLFARQVNAAAATGSGDSGQIDTTWVRSARLDWTIGTFTGGTTPNITLSLQVLGADGGWYTVYTGTAITAPVVGAGVNLAEDSANPVVFTKACRVVWTFGGAVAATSIALGLSLVGRA